MSPPSLSRFHDAQAVRRRPDRDQSPCQPVQEVQAIGGVLPSNLNAGLLTNPRKPLETSTLQLRSAA